MLTKSDRTRQFIVEQAAPLFNKQGYAGTSMQDIMDVTGLAKGGIYGNFENKDEIAAAAFDYSYKKMRKELGAVVVAERTASGRLMALLNFYKNYTISSTVEGGCVLLNTAVDADDAYPFLKKRAKAALAEMLGFLKGYFEMGVAKGEFRKTIKPQQEAENFFSMIEGAIMMAKVSDDPALLNRILSGLKDHIRDHVLIK